MGAPKCHDDLIIWDDEIISSKLKAAKKSHDDLMSWGDDGLDVEDAAMTKSHEDAISISSGSSEDVVLIEDCDLKQKARKTNHDVANHLKEPSSKKPKLSPWKKNKQEGWSLTEECEKKDDGMSKMDEMENYSFVRSHQSNATELCFECCVREKCCKKHKIVHKSKSMKWCLLVNDQEHTNAMKTMPSRQNRLDI